MAKDDEEVTETPDEEVPEGVADYLRGAPAEDESEEDSGADGAENSEESENSSEADESEDSETEEEATEEAAEEEEPPATKGDPSPAPVSAVDEVEKAYAEWQKEYEPLAAKIRSGELNPLDHPEEYAEAMKLQDKGLQLTNQRTEALMRSNREMQEARESDAYWAKYAEENPEVGIKARRWFDEEVKKAQKDFPEADGKTLARIATREWDKRIEGAKHAAKGGRKEESAPTKKIPTTPTRKGPPVTKGGAKITPTTTNPSKPPPPKPKTEDEEYEAMARQFGNPLKALGMG